MSTVTKKMGRPVGGGHKWNKEECERVRTFAVKQHKTLYSACKSLHRSYVSTVINFKKYGVPRIKKSELKTV